MRRKTTRRSFLKTTSAGTAATAFFSRLPRQSYAAAPFNPDFASAHETLAEIRGGVISCRELLQRVYARVEKYEPLINAFVTLNQEEAYKRAEEADNLLAQGKTLGKLHGLPILIKDSYRTAGLRTTSGTETLQDFVPADDAVAVARLRAAGAVIVGKTNLPKLAGDLQSFNDIAGTTNNPWDLRRTPGGSTGGGAAALAAGFGFLELGSDIGGSIRTPSSFCGIYGHKPTLNFVPLDGHIPPLPGTTRPLKDLSVAGPMARCAEDLKMELEIVAGPTSSDALAYKWHLPPARAKKLKDYRIGFVLDDPFCSVTPEVKERLAALVEQLGKAGVNLSEGWPEHARPQDIWENYLTLLAAFYSYAETEEDLAPLRDMRDGLGLGQAKLWLKGNALSHQEWLHESVKRVKTQEVWREYFKTHDAFIMPEVFTPAFPHDHSKTFFERTLSTSLGERAYGDMLKWICFATLTGCPATVAPSGRTRSGMPVGVQIMGPYMEDATPIDIASRIAEVVGGFEPPPDFV